MLLRARSSSSKLLSFNVLVVDIESESLSMMLNLASDEMVLIVDGDLVMNSRMMISLSLGVVVEGRGRADLSSSFTKSDSRVTGCESSDNELRSDS